MDRFNFEDYMDMGCPSCGADANEDCFEDCAGIPVPPQMWGFVEEQMAFVTHKVSQRMMKQFKMKIFTEKLEDIMTDLKDYKGLATAMVNSKTLETADSVLDKPTGRRQKRKSKKDPGGMERIGRAGNKKQRLMPIGIMPRQERDTMQGMSKGGMCRGMGAAVRGGNFKGVK